MEGQDSTKISNKKVFANIERFIPGSYGKRDITDDKDKRYRINRPVVTPSSPADIKWDDGDNLLWDDGDKVQNG